jgi:hypothetical protein
VSLDRDLTLTGELTHRAAARLCDRLEAPSADPAGDDPLAALIAELAVRAADTHAPRPRSRARRSRPELTRLDRGILTTRAAATGDVAPLVNRAGTSADARSRWR